MRIKPVYCELRDTDGTFIADVIVRPNIAETIGFGWCERTTRFNDVYDVLIWAARVHGANPSRCVLVDTDSIPHTIATTVSIRATF